VSSTATGNGKPLLNDEKPKSQLQNSSPRKIALLASLVPAAAFLLSQVCLRRRWSNLLAGSDKKLPKSSIFRWGGVLQLALAPSHFLPSSPQCRDDTVDQQ
jgi:hypothetical protein